ncbi:MAG: hypothetical protein ABIB97_04550 [Patescibacteria group bacterium]
MKKRNLKSLPRYLSIIALASLITAVILAFSALNLALWFFMVTVVLWAVAKFFHKRNQVSEDNSQQ